MPPILNSEVSLQHHSQFSIGGILYDTLTGIHSAVIYYYRNTGSFYIGIGVDKVID